MYQEQRDLTDLPVIAHPCLPKWRKRIDDAERRGCFTPQDRFDAAAWQCCAVGEGLRVYPSIKREGIDDKPIDGRLTILGIAFSNHVHYDLFACARKTITAIEQRLSELTR